MRLEHGSSKRRPVCRAYGNVRARGRCPPTVGVKSILLPILASTYPQERALRLQTASVSRLPGITKYYKTVSRFNPPSVVVAEIPIRLTDLRDGDEAPVNRLVQLISMTDRVSRAKQWITYERCEPSTMNRTWSSSILGPKSQSAYTHQERSVVR